MTLELRKIKEIDQSNYHYRVGQISDNKFNGWVKEIIADNGKITELIGYFQNDKLSGPFIEYLVNDKDYLVLRYGISINDVVYNFEEYINAFKLKETLIEELPFYALKYADVILYENEEDDKCPKNIYAFKAKDIITGKFFGRKDIDSNRQIVTEYGVTVNSNVRQSMIAIFEVVNLYKKDLRVDYFIDKSLVDKDFLRYFKKGWNISMESKEEIRISDGVTLIPEKFHDCEAYKTIFYIPKTVDRIEKNAIYSSKLDEWCVEIYYEGTMKEWDAIEKGEKVEEIKEDWYGYYYHNSDRYETCVTYHSWLGADHESIIIHCLDGDIETD